MPFCFSVEYLDFLIRTASLTCLVKQSLVFAVTSALYTAISPWWAAAWCLTMKEVCSPDLYLAMCSLLLVYKLRADSTMYTVQASLPFWTQLAFYLIFFPQALPN